MCYSVYAKFHKNRTLTLWSQTPKILLRRPSFFLSKIILKISNLSTVVKNFQKEATHKHGTALVYGALWFNISFDSFESNIRLLNGLLLCCLFSFASVLFIHINRYDCRSISSSMYVQRNFFGVFSAVYSSICHCDDSNYYYFFCCKYKNLPPKKNKNYLQTFSI